MATSPIYNWPEPDNTDLVKNGALAIRTMGNAIDTTMGTMVAKTIVDAKGDLIAATANDTPARLAVGANNLVLTADSSTATGLKYTGDWIPYTPVWGVVSGTAPTIGNGTLTGGYRRIGSVVDFYINHVGQSTTTWGSGLYTFSLPVALSSSEFNFRYGTVILDAGVTWYENFYGSGVAYGYADKFLIYNALGTTPISNTSPFVWGTGDGIKIFGSYRVVA